MIALSIALNDFLYLSFDLSAWSYSKDQEPYIIGIGLARGSVELADRHLFSLYFMLPLIGVCLGLLKYNWCAPFASRFPPEPPLKYLNFHCRYPARAFVGDTFCYFAGMAFAVVGILGHFSKTLLLFFIPQVFNFLYSFPQLAGIIPCPRHRLPRLNEGTGLCEPSYAVLKRKPGAVVSAALSLLEALRLLALVRDEKGTIIECSNLTILNLILVLRGPMREDRLTMWMMGVQVAGSAVAFGVRHGVAGLFYDKSRR